MGHSSAESLASNAKASTPRAPDLRRGKLRLAPGQAAKYPIEYPTDPEETFLRNFWVK